VVLALRASWTSSIAQDKSLTGTVVDSEMVLQTLFQLLKVTSLDRRSSPFPLSDMISQSLSSCFSVTETSPTRIWRLRRKLRRNTLTLVQILWNNSQDLSEKQKGLRNTLLRNLIIRKLLLMWGMKGSWLPRSCSINPGIHPRDFSMPLPTAVDTATQNSPIDVRRGLYKV